MDPVVAKVAETSDFIEFFLQPGAHLIECLAELPNLVTATDIRACAEGIFSESF